MKKTIPSDLSGKTLLSIGAMAKKSGVSASAIRGYEILGLLADAGIEVIRNGNFRYFKAEDAWKLSQIKAARLEVRNKKLADYGRNMPAMKLKANGGGYLEAFDNQN